MQIPAVNLQPCLEATRPAWTAHLDQLFTRMQFILGDHVSAFEREFAEATGAEEVVGVGNGTDAIELCLRQAQITSANQEVIAPALTAPFTAIGILAAGCRLRLADVDPDSLLLDPASARATATSDRTAAIVPVHLYGQPCDLVRFASIATEFGASLIQDACQAHGARFRGKPLTAYSSRVAYSFYPTKNLGCLGDGGAIATSKRSSAARMRMLRDGGRRGGRQNSYLRGINSRLDEMQACYLRAFLPRLEEWNNWRRKIAAIYDEMLTGIRGVRLVVTSSESVRHLYVIRAKRREKLRQHLSRNGIGTGVHYPVPLHHMQAFRDSGVKSGQLPVAEKACREVLSLPLWPYLPDSDARFVAEKIREFYGHRP
jgi:dTDP-3-amino-3,4,6-trideoxy-alpha-D-glucose transaminase